MPHANSKGCQFRVAAKEGSSRLLRISARSSSVAFCALQAGTGAGTIWGSQLFRVLRVLNVQTWWTCLSHSYKKLYISWRWSWSRSERRAALAILETGLYQNNSPSLWGPDLSIAHNFSTHLCLARFSSFVDRVGIEMVNTLVNLDGYNGYVHLLDGCQELGLPLHTADEFVKYSKVNSKFETPISPSIKVDELQHWVLLNTHIKPEVEKLLGAPIHHRTSTANLDELSKAERRWAWLSMEVWTKLSAEIRTASPIEWRQAESWVCISSILTRNLDCP